MASTANQNPVEKKLIGLYLPCGECSHAKSISITEEDMILVDCWSSGLVIFDLKSENPTCKNQNLKDLCPNILLLSRK